MALAHLVRGCDAGPLPSLASLAQSRWSRSSPAAPRVGCDAWRTPCCFLARVPSSSAWPTLGRRIRPGRRCWKRHPTALGRVDRRTGCRDEGALATTAFVQPALLACDVAAFRVLRGGGLDGRSSVWPATRSASSPRSLPPDAVALPDALELVVCGARRCSGPARNDPGAMTALLGVGAEDAEALCDGGRAATTYWWSRTRTPPPRSSISGIVAGDRTAGGAREGTQDRGRSACTWRARSTRELMRPAVQPDPATCSSDIEIRDARDPDRRERHRRRSSPTRRELRELVGAARGLARALGDRRSAGAGGRGRHHVPGGRARATCSRS